MVPAGHIHITLGNHYQIYCNRVRYHRCRHWIRLRLLCLCRQRILHGHIQKQGKYKTKNLLKLIEQLLKNFYTHTHRYNNNRSASSSSSSSSSSLRNGLTSSPRSKYLEQTDPVNLAVSQQQQSTSSQRQQSQHSKLDDVGAANIYGTHKLPYGSTQAAVAAAAAAAAADAYNFSNLYNRPETIYG